MNEADFKKLVKSVKQAGRIRRGKLRPGRMRHWRADDIKAIRGRLRKSQSEFALMIGVSTSTLQNWEQGRRHPDGPARSLLRVAAANPAAVAEALSAK